MVSDRCTTIQVHCILMDSVGTGPTLGSSPEHNAPQKRVIVVFTRYSFNFFILVTA